MSAIHPRPNDQGKPVVIQKPSAATPLSAWSDPAAMAAVLPAGTTPPALHAVPFAAWKAPADDSGWDALAHSMPTYEPEFVCPTGLKPAAGAVVVEPDGRCWAVAPTNRFGGHAHTFPKGRTDGRSLKAAALVEVFEEAGLAVELTAWLCDVNRSVTRTRFYLARRVNGTPASMGWESQCTILAPVSALRQLLTHPADQQVLDALEKR